MKKIVFISLILFTSFNVFCQNLQRCNSKVANSSNSLSLTDSLVLFNHTKNYVVNPIQTKAFFDYASSIPSFNGFNHTISDSIHRYGYVNSNIGIILIQRKLNSFDAKDRITQSIEWIYFVKNKIWLESTKTTYHYFGADSTVILLQTKTKIDSPWANDTKWVCSYDGLGEYDSIQYKYDANQWTPQRRWLKQTISPTEYQELIFQTNLNKAWDSTDLIRYKFDANHNLIDMYTSKYGTPFGGKPSFQDVFHYQNEYDENNKLTKEAIYNLSDSNTPYEDTLNISFYHYTYGRIDSIIHMETDCGVVPNVYKHRNTAYFSYDSVSNLIRREIKRPSGLNGEMVYEHVVSGMGLPSQINFQYGALIPSEPIINDNTGIEVYPNPNYSGLIFVKSSSALHDMCYVTDVIGRRRNFKIYQNSIDASSLPTGLYLFEFKSNGFKKKLKVDIVR